MKIPFIDLKRVETNFHEILDAKLDLIIKDAKFIGGEEVENFENRLAHKTGVSHAVTCGNGTDALQLALRAVGVKKGDPVLVPDLTFWATYEAVINVGAIPSTVDISLDDASMDINVLSDAIDQANPKAVIIVHLYGWGSCRLSDIRALCNERNIPLIEDGAHVFGTLYREDPIYKNALISTTSFYPAKVFGGAGDGGAVFTNRPDLAKAVRALGNHGRTSHYEYNAVGWNSRLDAIQAAYLSVVLDFIDERINSRRLVSAYYTDRLRGMGAEVISSPEDYLENGYCNVVIIKEQKLKSHIEKSLKMNNIAFANIYPSTISDQSGAQQHTHTKYGVGKSRILSSSVLNLPLFHYMTMDEASYVMDIFSKNFLNWKDHE
jgi:UDP-2-acetamido-2-deoxy-ribo-hexuluronate aminotransferase